MAGTRALGRRDFLRTAAVLGSGLAGVALTGVARAQTVARAWVLDPDWGYPRGERGATSCRCRACLHHAKNKIFASRAALEGDRAHAGCLCTSGTIELPGTTYRALFGRGVDIVDRRDPDVASILSTGGESSSGATGRGRESEAAAAAQAAPPGADIGPLILTAAVATAGAGAVVAARRRRGGSEGESL